MLANRSQAVVPDRIEVDFPRQFLRREDLRMNANGEHLFVMAAVEDADASALWKPNGRAPKKIVIEFEDRWPLEREYLATGGIDTLHDGADRTVFTGGIHRLEYQQHGAAVAGSEYALQLVEILPRIAAMHALMRMAVGLWLRAGITDPEAVIERHEIHGVWRFEHYCLTFVVFSSATCCASAHSTCSATNFDFESRRLFNASVTSGVVRALPSATAIFRNQRS